MLNVNAKRRIEGCSCQESTVGQVRLPHTPRAEDIDLTHDPKNGIVSVKMARHAKADEPTPLPIKILEPEPTPDVRQNLRFIPHESAVPKQQDEANLESDEKQLLDKFRAVGAVARAVASPQAAEPTEPETKKNNEPKPVAGYEP